MGEGWREKVVDEGSGSGCRENDEGKQRIKKGFSQGKFHKGFGVNTN